MLACVYLYVAGIELLDLSNYERVDDMGLKVLAAGENLQTLKTQL